MFLKIAARCSKPFLLLAATLLPVIARADEAMPWENSLLQIQHALTGTTAHIIIVIAIAMAGIAYAVGEHGSIFRRAAGIIFGGCIATGATSLYMALKFSGSGL